MIGLCVPTAARADSVTPLGTYNASDMVVDSARDQVIVSAGPGSTELQVLSYDGEILDSIGALGGTVGITVVGSTLYAAEYDDGAISAVVPHDEQRHRPRGDGPRVASGARVCGRPTLDERAARPRSREPFERQHHEFLR